MEKFYASLCIKDDGGYVTIEANDMNEARDKMFASEYGKQWAFMYSEVDKAESLDAFNQTERGYIA